jgi:hypothetical protein
MKKWILGGLVALSATAFAAPGTVTVQHLTDAPSYFSITIAGNGTLDGTYPGWCTNWARHIDDNIPYSFHWYSSYSETIPTGLIAHPENLDEMNWLINQKYAGKDAGAGLGVYTSGDVQLAIWTLIDDEFDSSTIGPFSQARVDKIVALALQHNDYKPKCRDDIGILVDPGTPQGTVFEIPKENFYKCKVPEDDTK